MYEVEELFVDNPLVYSDLKKYIWFKDDAEQKEGALALFCRLLISGVYIYGFATDEERYIGEKSFNKVIVDIKELNSEEAVVFIEKEYDEKLYGICQTIKVVNPKVNQNNMVIFGVGKYGTEVFDRLSKKGMKKGIYCFIDSDKEKYGKGKYKEGLPVYSPEILFELGEDFSVIEGAEKYREMDQQLDKAGILQKRFYYREDRSDFLKYIWGYDKDVELRVGTLADMGKAFDKKKVYLYGNITKGAIKTANMLELLDYGFGGFLVDDRNDCGRIISNYPIRVLEEVIKEKNYYLLLSNESKKECARKLKAIGLKKGLDYNYTTLFSWGSIKKSMWDMNLGYTYDEGSKYPGFAVYGEENKANYKIAILGNSTTDDNFTDFNGKCWPAFLYEKCKSSGVTIYNGGSNGYTSTQELIKLIRDVLPLKPDMIIVYDGFIDICENADKPFAFSYLNKLLEDARNGREIEIYKGMEREGSIFQNWLSNIVLMQAVAKASGSKFLAFAQPSRFYIEKENICEYFLSSTWFWDETAKNQHLAFKKELKQQCLMCGYDYIYDLTDIFDDKEDVYIDSCHLYDEGNEIIADEILKVIISKFSNNESV